jgi:hypothetical protein
MGARAAQDSLDAPPEIQGAVTRLLSRSPLKSRKQTILAAYRKLDLHAAGKNFSRGINTGKPWKMSDIDGDEDADIEEYVLWLLSWDLSKQAQPVVAFVEIFGEELGLLLQTTSHHFTGSLNVAQTMCEDDDEHDASDGSIADDVHTPLANKLRRALEDSYKVMNMARVRADAEKAEREKSSSLTAGAKVMLINLKSRPELNCVSATLLSRCKPPVESAHCEERWIIRLESGEQLAAKKMNMVVTGLPQSSVQEQQLDDVEAFKQAVAAASSVLDAVLRESIEPRPSKALRRLLREAYVFRGNLRVMKNMRDADCPPSECQVIQLDAAFAAFFSKRQLPDAFWLRGAAQLLRRNMAEAVQELSAALLWPASEWVWQRGRQLAEQLLPTARMGLTPLCGAWEELACERGRAPGRRVGAASCTAGHMLYLFGGLRPRASDAAAMRALSSVPRNFNGEAPASQRPLGDLWAYDARARAWEKLGGPGPPARAFGLLAHDPVGNGLYLYAGRETWGTHEAGERRADLWRFDLAARRWRELPGSHPGGVSLGPAAVHGGGFLVVDPHASPGEGPAGLELARLDLATGRWRRRWCGGGGPRLVAPAAGWAQDGRLFVYSEERKVGEGVRSVVWSVDLDGGAGWTPHVLSGREGEGEERFSGMAPVPWTEGSACFDSVTRKAYLVWGWTEVWP